MLLMPVNSIVSAHEYFIQTAAFFKNLDKKMQLVLYEIN